ncbi:MAG TPA: DinB family protein [Candidatus Bathyarchaeia archaeon]|nr:DinB family protein [Candidatus Bathyarchaeia archaeon]
MTHPRVKELRAGSDKAWALLRAQLQGMDPYLDRSDSPGQWTAREVLCHLLFEPGWKPAALLKTFAVKDLPIVEIKPGDSYLTPERKTMTLKQFKDALEAQHRDVGNYLEGLGEADLGRKARIPIFKEIMGIEEIDIPTFVGALFEYHWNDHAGQLGKIRRAVGLPDAK